MFFATSVDLRPNCFGRSDLRLQDLADVHLGDAHVPVRVALNPLQLGQIVFAQMQHDTFADHRDPVATAVAIRLMMAPASVSTRTFSRNSAENSSGISASVAPAAWRCRESGGRRCAPSR